MRPGLVIGAVLLLLAACGGKHEERVENLYAVKAAEFNQDGVAAMRIERWAAAERAFGRSLKAAQLADLSEMVVHAWYNLGAVRAAQSKLSTEAAYQRAVELAERYHMPEMRMRARLALALWRAEHGQAPAAIDLSGGWPADIQLMGGRLAQLQHDSEAARTAYEQAARSAGRDASGLKLKAEAHMGLALLARDAGDIPGVRSESDRALDLCRQTGAPRLTAHLLLLRASLHGVTASRTDEAERAYAIYQALSDNKGEMQSLQVLKTIALADGDAGRAAAIQTKIDAMSASAESDGSKGTMEEEQQ